MTLKHIKGTFRIVGASPDGDSVRFYPYNPDAFRVLNLLVRTNAHGGAQLRLDAIDALETHYTPRGGHVPWHQPRALGEAASSSLLEYLGFTNVERDERGTVVRATPEQVPGYILTRFADKYGRAVSFAFRGSRRRTADLVDVYLDAEGLRASANWQQLRAGMAYPTYYSKLFPDLREELSATVTEARSEGLGIWAEDVTTTGFRLTSRQQLTDDLVIMPKLFRRLAEYLELDTSGGASLDRFASFLETSDDRLFTIPDGHATSFDTLVHVRRQRLRLITLPEHIVFLEK